MSATFQPVIKWSGSKRSQSNELLSMFPNEFDTYYEPFVGGGSMLMALLKSDKLVKNYICSDINKDLIELWNYIKQYPKEVSEHYNTLWNELNKDDDRTRKKKFFELIREKYNHEHNPLDFMFIMRTTTNGMPRYNLNGEFNNSFHVTRNGIIPSKLEKIIYYWSKMLNDNNVTFICQDYKSISPNENDFVYLDPPYANTKGMYYGAIDNDELFKFLRNLKCKWMMSFDGISGDVDNTYNVPTDIYKEHKYIKSGNSSFKRTIGKSNDSIVYESLYKNF